MEHQLVLSSYIVEELKGVIKRKFEIRDVNDYPVLYTAILEDVDILVTGDSDFRDVDVERPEILTPAEFVERYC